jgi:hypothetical protein
MKSEPLLQLRASSVGCGAALRRKERCKRQEPEPLYRRGMRNRLEKKTERHTAWQVPNITNPT